MAKGVIYICSTVVDGLIKIGKTSDFESRMKLLESNGYRNVTGLKREFAIEVENYDALELLIQRLFSKSRVGNTELFTMDLNDAIYLLSSMSGKQIYPENETKEEVSNEAAENVRTAFLPDGIYTIAYKMRKDGIAPHGIMAVQDGKATLQKGAVVAPLSEKADKNLKAKIKELRIEDNTLMEDVVDVSVSMAASIVAGFNENGWRKWTDEKGITIDSYRNNAEE